MTVSSVRLCEAMKGSGLTLVLSGHLCRPQTADHRTFWHGFIELQRRLPADKKVEKIVAHSWNPELADLVSNVYAPNADRHEHQRCFHPEFASRIDPSDRFAGAADNKSGFLGDPIQYLLEDARSRARAIQLLDETQAGQGQVLIVRWDLWQASDSRASRVVADASLPEEYVYLPYASDVDEGYDDSWILAPMHLARRFVAFDSFVLDSLSGKNQYLELFTKKGWPRARAKSRWETFRAHPIWRKLAEIPLIFSQAVWRRSQGRGFIQKVTRKVMGPMHRHLERPPLTAENSCMPGFEKKLPVFPALRAVNNNALLKYFLLSEGMRGCARFLTDEDFELAAASGQLIRPQQVVLLVRQGDAATLPRLKLESRLPLAALFHLGGSQVTEHLRDEKGDWSTRVLEPKSSGLRDQLSCGLSAAARSGLEKTPVLIIPSIDEYLGCTDWYFLNALLKYIAWRDVGYVRMETQGGGSPHPEFPELKLVQGNGALSFRSAAGTVAGIQEYLEVADSDLQGLAHRASTMRLEFPALAKEMRLF